MAAPMRNRAIKMNACIGLLYIGLIFEIKNFRFLI